MHEEKSNRTKEDKNPLIAANIHEPIYVQKLSLEDSNKYNEKVGRKKPQKTGQSN